MLVTLSFTLVSINNPVETKSTQKTVKPIGSMGSEPAGGFISEDR